MGALEDDLTEHHRMRTIEDLRKEFLEIEALRKELAALKEPHKDPDDLLTQLLDPRFIGQEGLRLAAACTIEWMRKAEGILRKELAEAKAALEVYDRTFPKKSELELHAELEAANARTGKCGMEGHNEPCHYCGEPCNSLVGRPSRWPVALCHEDDPGIVKWHHTGCVMERLAKGDAANARIAELENQLSEGRRQFMHEIAKYQSEHCFRLLYQSERDEAIAHAERAEAEADSLRATIDNMRAMNIKLTMEATGQALAAEAECKAMRETLKYCYLADGRAALNPSPADPSGDTPRQCPSE